MVHKSYGRPGSENGDMSNVMHVESCTPNARGFQG